MDYFQRRKILKSTSANDLIPVRVHGHDVEDGKVVILVPKFTGKWMHNLFPRTQQLFYRIKLDQPGSLTWNHITGDNTVGEIIAAIQEEQHSKGESMDEADNRISKFISVLYDWKYITFRQIQ